jgi:probable phosphoglycerate mutase
MSEQNFKRIYFVRHGESTNNVARKNGAHLDLTDDSELTEDGIDQANKLAGRFKNIKIDKFFSSPYKRAKQTADEIKKIVDMDYEIIEAAREKSGENKEGCLSQIYGLDDDSENFDSIISRVKEVIKIIESTPEENILVVSHGMFLRVFAAYVILGDKLTPEITELFMQKLMTKNTGIFKFYMFDDHWRLGTWNDDYHI